MRGRLFVVNKETIENVRKNNELSVMIPNSKRDGKIRKQWCKTIIDVFSDISQLSIGDYIFLWKTKKDDDESKIYGIYEVTSKAYITLQENDTYPVRIRIKETFNFREPLTEYEIINDYEARAKLWNVIGKKIAGKARGSTPLSSEETLYLFEKLKDKNKEVFKVNVLAEGIPEKSEEIVCDLSKTYNELKDYEDITIAKIGHKSSIDSITFKYEKSLELYFNLMFRDNHKLEIESLGIDSNKVEWFANYLPYSSEANEIDYMVIETSNDKPIYNVIEFQRGESDIDHITRTLKYTKWVQDYIGNNITPLSARAILICSKNRITKEEKKQNEHKYGILLDIYTYEILDKSLHFEKKE